MVATGAVVGKRLELLLIDEDEDKIVARATFPVDGLLEEARLDVAQLLGEVERDHKGVGRAIALRALDRRNESRRKLEELTLATLHALLAHEVSA
jgi:hypothetical protein